ncbi:Flavoprotein-like domain [Phytophthora cactorum]|nr:Flavoprotein-like domain [Phytophthora cactorum]
MAKIAIVYYSTYNHVSTMAETIKKGIESVDGVAETLPEELLTRSTPPPRRITHRHPGHPEGGGRHPVRLPHARSLTRAGPVGCWCSSGQARRHLLQHGHPGRRSGDHGLHSLTFLAHQGLTYVPLGYRAPELANMEESTAARPGVLAPWPAVTVLASRRSWS